MTGELFGRVVRQAHHERERGDCWGVFGMVALEALDSCESRNDGVRGREWLDDRSNCQRSLVLDVPGRVGMS